MSRPTVDLQLTTLEFEGLAHALAHYTWRSQQAQAVSLTEEELLLLPYAAKITPANVLRWKQRRLRENRRASISDLARPRYSYRADWLLVRVLLRLLAQDWDLHEQAACRMLLRRLRDVDEQERRMAGLYRATTARTDQLSGIVEALALPGPTDVDAGSGLPDRGTYSDHHATF